MQSLECVELFLFVLWPKMSVPDIKNLGLYVIEFVSTALADVGFSFLPAFIASYLIYDWGTKRNQQESRKNPKDYEHET